MKWSRFIFGAVVFPAAFAGYGVYVWMSGRGYVVGGQSAGPLLVTGQTAKALGVSCFGLAALLHFRFGWSEQRGLWRIAPVGEILGAITWLAGLGYVIWAVLARNEGR